MTVQEMYDTAEVDRLERLELWRQRGQEEPARNVVEALIRVVRDLPAVGKDEKMTSESGGYKYRGIEAMTAAAQPLFGKHGVLVCPRVKKSTVTPITKGNKPWVHREMEIEYLLRGPNGPDDYVLIGPLFVEADDNSDKSANKALTQGLKQMLLQVLLISDRKDDPDEANESRDAPQAPETVGIDLAEPTYQRAEKDGYSREELDATAADAVGRPVKLPEVLRTEWAIVRDAWIVYRREHPKNAPPAPGLLSPDDGPAPADAVRSSEASTEADTSQGLPAGGAAELGSRAKKAAK